MSPILSILFVICALNSINCHYQDVEQPAQADLQPAELPISHAGKSTRDLIIILNILFIYYSFKSIYHLIILILSYLVNFRQPRL